MTYHEYVFEVSESGTVRMDSGLDLQNFAYLTSEMGTMELPEPGDLYRLAVEDGCVCFVREPGAMYKMGHEPTFEQVYDQHMEASKYTD